MNPLGRTARLGRARWWARAQGFSLVEMAMVLLVVGLLAALFLPATNTMMDNNRRKDTRTKLEVLEAAMTRFVMTNKRLPCPADGALPMTDANFGLEVRVEFPPAGSKDWRCDAMVRGVVPWRTLGLGVNEALDAWGTLVTYRVWAKTTLAPSNGINTSLAMDYDLSINNMGMNLSDCKPASTGAATLATNYSCSATASPLSALTAAGVLAQARGFRACDSAPACGATVLPNAPGANELARRIDGNGVAYFLISHGANKFGGYTPGGVPIVTASGSGPGPRENINRNGIALRNVSPNDFYVDADYDENPATYYDDIVLRPTVLKVALDAGLGPQP